MGLKSQDPTMAAVSRTAAACDPDPAHSEKVTTLALALFDGLGRLHGYGPKERRLLEIAGRLHDIGWSQVVSGKHHKLSRDLILELEIPGLTKRDQETCALIARYHTKAVPDASRHRGFASLEAERREVVEWLSGMLRVADGLDCRHSQAVGQLTCEVSREAIAIHLRSAGDCGAEIEGAREKQDLLEGKTGRRIEYRC